MNTIFNDLIIFEMANNHQGDINHGLKIIKELGNISKKYNLNAAVKFQYRQLETFIHQDFVHRKDVKHIPRFLSTQLNSDDFKVFLDAVKKEGMKTMVTPFDEDSVQICFNQGVDIIKVASCSARDWPLLEEIAKVNRPIIASTGGSTLEQIDSLVSFLKHKNCDFGIMHCVGIYPTKDEQIGMNFLEKMIYRYPGIPVGWSGHEAPDNIEPAKIAVAKGAKMMERHVGVETDTIKLNAYSMNPNQVEKWLDAIQMANAICGPKDEKVIIQEETDSLLSLQRGVFCKRSISKGQKIIRDDVYFAMPCATNQLTSGEFGTYRAEYVASKNYDSNEAIKEEAYDKDDISTIRNLIHTVNGMLHESKVIIPQEASLEISHHHGIEKVFETGAILFSIVNREYCKKILICLPGQTNPMHMHKIKEETFQLLSGDLQLIFEDKVIELEPGETFLIEPNIWHGFTSQNGAIFEEISSTHRRADSFYQDPDIAKKDPMERKTLINDWQ